MSQLFGDVTLTFLIFLFSKKQNLSFNWHLTIILSQVRIHHVIRIFFKLTKYPVLFITFQLWKVNEFKMSTNQEKYKFCNSTKCTLVFILHSGLVLDIQTSSKTSNWKIQDWTSSNWITVKIPLIGPQLLALLC